MCAAACTAASARHSANGRRPLSASALLVDRLMLGALAAVVAGHYLVAFGRSVAGVTAPSLVGDSGPMTLALAAIGIVWWLQRQGRSPGERTVAQAIGASVVVLLVLLFVSAAISVAVLVERPHPAADASARSAGAGSGAGIRVVGARQRRVAEPGRPGSRAATNPQPAAGRPARRRLRRRRHGGSGVSVRRCWCAIRTSGARRRSRASRISWRHPSWLRQVLLSLVAAAAAVFLAATLRSSDARRLRRAGAAGGRRVPRRPVAGPASPLRNTVAQHRRGRRRPGRHRAALGWRDVVDRARLRDRGRR